MRSQRSIISQEMLNGLVTLYIEKKMLDEIYINAIISDLVGPYFKRNFELICMYFLNENSL